MSYTANNNGLISKVIKHGDTMIILAAIASMFFYFDAKFTADNERFFDQQKQFQSQQQQFTELVREIGKVDADARVRSKELEMLIVSKTN